MDNAFYPKNKYRKELANFEFEDSYEDDVLYEPPSSSSNMNFFNPVQSYKNGKSRRHINFDNKRLSISKPVNGRNGFNELNESSSKIPNIHRNHKVQNGNKLNLRNSRMSKEGSKGASTSRNTHLNQSYNQMPSIKQKLAMKNDPEAFLSPRLDESYQKFASPRYGTNEMIFRLQRKVNELKEMLAESQSQCDFLKRTIKYTEINEIKQENQMLYTECKRLKRFVNILTNKDSDEDLNMELDEQVDHELNYN